MNISRQSRPILAVLSGIAGVLETRLGVVRGRQPRRFKLNAVNAVTLHGRNERLMTIAIFKSASCCKILIDLSSKIKSDQFKPIWVNIIRGHWV
jgi:hypothetical protein